MNERIKQLAEQAGLRFTQLMSNPMVPVVDGRETDLEKFAQLIVAECVGILETEIELVNGYKSTAHNDFDIRWHEGKIEHFAKLIEKNKKHFGVAE